MLMHLSFFLGGVVILLLFFLCKATSGDVFKTIYTSPPLDKFKFDAGDSYSPPIAVTADNLDIDNSEPVYVQLTIVNNARNVQIPVGANGLNMKISWEPKDEGYTHRQFHNLLSEEEL